MNKELISTKKVIKIINFKQSNPNKKRLTPSLYAKRKRERALATSLYNLKHAQRYPGKNGNVFYPILEKVAEALNEPKLFSYVDRKQKAIDNLNMVLDWIKENGRFPKGTQKDSLEFKCRKLMENFYATKIGRIPGVWYPILDEMIKNSPYPDYFKVEDSKIIPNDVDDLIKFYRKNKRLPTQLIQIEKPLYNKLLRYKQSKAGKNIFAWNPDIDKHIKQLKIRNIFV
jgi:hypothetical protein